MSAWKDIAKGGWHPEKGGKGRTGLGDSRGISQIKGWVGKGDSTPQDRRGHQSTPLSSLKDPALFEPPPKQVDRPVRDSADYNLEPKDRDSVPKAVTASRAAEVVDEKVSKPPTPYRPNTTGLSTANLPKPPLRRRDPSADDVATFSSKAKPSLPPRLPPRENSITTTVMSPNQAVDNPLQNAGSTDGFLNRGSINRLGKAGISVAGLNIGEKSSPSLPQRTDSPAASGTPSQSRAQPGNSGQTSPAHQAPRLGTSFAEKKAALRTAQSFRQDPSSVSMADARSAALTANNFRQRHGEQAVQGWKQADKLDKRYGVADRLGVHSPSAEPTKTATPPLTQDMVVVAARKKPPPPPPPIARKAAEPPPIPVASKPK
ncbi:MAG: hypothetical protein M1817_001103 [Caeruleum heppii]|nr:MAG: hypothetical protein M1817_001103 [Caeruleum heppii]